MAGNLPPCSAELKYTGILSAGHNCKPLPTGRSALPPRKPSVMQVTAQRRGTSQLSELPPQGLAGCAAASALFRGPYTDCSSEWLRAGMASPLPRCTARVVLAWQGWSTKDLQRRQATKGNVIAALRHAEPSSHHSCTLIRGSAAKAKGGMKSIVPQQQPTSAKGPPSERSGCGQQARTVREEHPGTGTLHPVGKAQC